MKKDVERYIRGCSNCQMFKTSKQRLTPPLQPHNVPKGPWHTIALDLIGPLPKSNGYDAILTVIDRFTKKAFFLPTMSTVTSMGIAKLYRDNVFREHGLPKKMISDWGTQFMSSFMKELQSMLKIVRNPLTAYHPQTDGQAERANAIVKEFLTFMVNKEKDDWTEWLAIAQFSYNNRVHTTTGYSPFYLTYGQHPYKGQYSVPSERSPLADEFAKRMKEIWDQTMMALEKANEVMKKANDQKGVVKKAWLPGQKVLVSTTNFPSRKKQAAFPQNTRDRLR